MSLSFNLDSYVDWIEKEAQSGSSRFDLFSVDYVKSHQIRYAKTIDLIDRCQASSALEVGATDFFQIYLAAARGINNTWATIFSNNIENKYYRKSFYAAGYEANSQVVSINLENELLPIGEENFDLILFCEVIEHLDEPRLAALEKIVFKYAKPIDVIVTTPNAEYNKKFEGLSAGQMRHSDHRFEWTRAEFEQWGNRIAEEYNYDVVYKPVGEEDPEVGALTQMALFTTKQRTIALNRFL